MAQIFHPSTNTLARLGIVGAAITVGLVAWGAQQSRRTCSTPTSKDCGTRTTTDSERSRTGATWPDSSSLRDAGPKQSDQAS